MSNRKEYKVSVLYTMVHIMYVEADSPSEARALAMDRFSGEPDLSEDEIDGVLRANVIPDHDDTESEPVMEGENGGK